MATLSELAQAFMDGERPAGNLLDEDGVRAQALAATRFYAGFALLRCFDGVEAERVITSETVISLSEWAVIRPLFLLYVDRETAIQLEASRTMGIDPYGRSVSEIATDITQVEAEMPQRAFFQPIVTI